MDAASRIAEQATANAGRLAININEHLDLKKGYVLAEMMAGVIGNEVKEETDTPLAGDQMRKVQRKIYG